MSTHHADLDDQEAQLRSVEELDAHVAELVDRRRVLRAQLDDRGEHRPDWRG